MDIIQKSWKVSTPPLKKLLSRAITYHLSKRLNKNKYEVVFEGFLDAHNQSSGQPDVVIYSNHGHLVPELAIEICRKDEMIEMIILAKRMIESYKLKEFFIFDNESDDWYMLDENGNGKFSSISSVFAVDLKKMTDIYPRFFPL